MRENWTCVNLHTLLSLLQNLNQVLPEPASPYSESPLHEEPMIMSPSSCTDDPGTATDEQSSTPSEAKIKNSMSTSEEQEAEELAAQTLCDVKGYPLKPALKRVVRNEQQPLE